MNVYCCDEPVSTDTIQSYTPSIDDGYTFSQLFVGTKSLVSDVYGMKKDKQFVNTLEDNIHVRGEMSKFISDWAQSEVINHSQSILWALFIDDCQSEPHCQHQNFVERCYQTVKRLTNTIIDRTGDPSYTCILDLIYM